MDTLNRDRDLIERIISEHAAIPYAYGDIKRMAVFDRERDHYLLMVAGFDPHREHGCVIHVDLIDGKFWIQRDGTEYSVARELTDAGVLRDRIVLAFHEPRLRKHTEFAEA